VVRAPKPGQRKPKKEGGKENYEKENPLLKDEGKGKKRKSQDSQGGGGVLVRGPRGHGVIDTKVL